MNEMETIKISKKLFGIINDRIKNLQTGFSTPDEYIEYVLTELFNDETEEISTDEQNEIDNELRKMGYIN